MIEAHEAVVGATVRDKSGNIGVIDSVRKSAVFPGTVFVHYTSKSGVRRGRFNTNLELESVPVSVPDLFEAAP